MAEGASALSEGTFRIQTTSLNGAAEWIDEAEWIDAVGEIGEAAPIGGVW